MIKFLEPQWELDFLREGAYSRIVGLDEVGRGCWAGPVAVGAYVFEAENEIYKGVQDSKKLSPARRELLFTSLSKGEYRIAFGNVDQINEEGIGVTIQKLIFQLIEFYRNESTYFLIDGQFATDFGSNTKKLIRADSTFYSVAAASILAKVVRDNLMSELGLKYPLYNFPKHKGYATKEHRELIAKFGICDLHRTSFKPLRAFVL